MDATRTIIYDADAGHWYAEFGSVEELVDYLNWVENTCDFEADEKAADAKAKAKDEQKPQPKLPPVCSPPPIRTHQELKVPRPAPQTSKPRWQENGAATEVAERPKPVVDPQTVPLSVVAHAGKEPTFKQRVIDCLKEKKRATVYEIAHATKLESNQVKGVVTMNKKFFRKDEEGFVELLNGAAT